MNREGLGQKVRLRMREGGRQNWRHTRKFEDKGSEVLMESRSKAGEGRGDRTGGCGWRQGPYSWTTEMAKMWEVRRSKLSARIGFCCQVERKVRDVGRRERKPVVSRQGPRTHGKRDRTGWLDL